MTPKGTEIKPNKHAPSIIRLVCKECGILPSAPYGQSFWCRTPILIIEIDQIAKTSIRKP